MKRPKLSHVLLTFFTACLFTLEHMYLISVIDRNMIDEYSFFQFLKFLTLGLTFWVLYNNYNLVPREPLEPMEETKHRKTYTYFLFIFGLAYVTIISLFIFTRYDYYQ